MPRLTELARGGTACRADRHPRRRPTGDATGEAALVPRLTELLGAAPLVAQTGTADATGTRRRGRPGAAADRARSGRHRSSRRPAPPAATGDATGEAALVPRLTELARGGTACRADRHPRRRFDRRRDRRGRPGAAADRTRSGRHRSSRRPAPPTAVRPPTRPARPPWCRG